MSTDYDIKCFGCGGTSTALDDCRDSQMLGAVAASIRSNDPRGVVQAIRASYSEETTRRLLVFALEHLGHACHVWDEYGRRMDACGERFDCDSCGHSNYCSLPVGHLEEHHK